MLKTNVIPIVYDIYHLDDAYKLKKILDNNKELFQIFLYDYKKISFIDDFDDINTLNILSLSDFKARLSLVIPKYLEAIREKVYEAGGDNIETDLLRMMIIDKLSSETLFIDQNVISDIYLNINVVYAILGILYCKDQVMDLIFNEKSEVKQYIFKALNKKHRYNLMNLLLEEEYYKILSLEELEQDSYLRNNLDYILELSTIDIVERLKPPAPPENKKTVATLSKTEQELLCEKFLVEIDPSLKWLELYNDLKQKHHILYNEQFPDKFSNGWGCIETPEGIFIYAPLEGTIRDFPYFIHEFTHYITLYHKDKLSFIPSMLQEFPAIFFEKQAREFLKKQGYSIEDIEVLAEERNQDILDNKKDISPSLRYLIDYLNEGKITFECEKKKMDELRKKIPVDVQENIKEVLNDILLTKDKNNVHKKIDAENLFLIANPNCIFDICPYIVGNKLAEETIEKSAQNELVIPTMISVTENLAKETTDSVILKLKNGTTSNSIDKIHTKK